VCKNKALGHVRAVKVLEKMAIEESEQDRFFSEINILKMMDHPNIVKLYEVYQDKKRYYLVTE
jgi:calcium-dependent protein kinase